MNVYIVEEIDCFEFSSIVRVFATLAMAKEFCANRYRQNQWGCVMPEHSIEEYEVE